MIRTPPHAKHTAHQSGPKRFAMVVTLSLLALSSVSCAQGGGIQAAKLPPSTIRDGTGVAALRVTAPDGATSLLIGSLHAAADGLRQPAASVMAGARHYVVEGVPEASSTPPAFADEVQQGRAARAPWASFLTPVQVNEARRRAHCIEQLHHLTPVAIGSVVERMLRYRSAQRFAGLAIYRCASLGLRSRDALLAEAAAAQGLAPTPLETQRAAQAQRDAVPERIYVAQAYDAFRADGDAALRRVVGALNAGDFEAVAETVRATSRSPEDARIVYEIMVAQRNLAWLPALRRLLDDGDAVIVVGAYHLPGPQGLTALLQAQGYVVAPTEIPAAP